ncbi:MAG: hypothetical protein UY15_C0021G0030 [Parcubacteria group bacterium GW2011_GWA2_47_9]|uniref:Uncharacterized protein n=1 Tax=Candidatus Wildermuthbacteria bacterium RIFCSPHIGHO2_02_FULL_47_17 TaxID=1802452 RepID=A0A1G2R3K8_9BACT|nr:MAG: hypothetical protein UY15_C0021G0030 [Parcubacteria group bacterium GW2011_GWA2_47_9]OHA67383.1 MAG: hypothetical protein A3D59_01295 [Candidatus Wildermuthbacteria bacterium RIFCSPHIGHO2_02_FULL_47_17]
MTIIIHAVIKGLLGAVILLGIYFAAITLISGWAFAREQFYQYWYFVVALAAGFGVQVGLYSYLRSAVRRSAPGQVLAVGGTTSTAAMISCCSHYLVNMLPILGVTGFISLISQYQIELFWIGLAFNAAGIIYMLKKVINLRRV